MNWEAKIYSDLMDMYFRRWRVLGFTQAGSAEEYFGFHYNYVAAVHFHKRGEGKGVWFRLHDGRVFDILGHPDDPDPIWYEATMH